MYYTPSALVPIPIYDIVGVGITSAGPRCCRAPRDLARNLRVRFSAPGDLSGVLLGLVLCIYMQGLALEDNNCCVKNGPRSLLNVPVTITTKLLLGIQLPAPGGRLALGALELYPRLFGGL